MKFTEAKLEQAIIELLGEQGYDYLAGEQLARADKNAGSHRSRLA